MAYSKVLNFKCFKTTTAVNQKTYIPNKNKLSESDDMRAWLVREAKNIKIVSIKQTVTTTQCQTGYDIITVITVFFKSKLPKSKK